MYDCIIIGAGVVGGLIARNLARFDLNVCIVEAGSDVAIGATKANSGIVHAGYDAESGSKKALLNVRGSELMEKLCRDLGVKFKRNGALVIANSESEAAHLTELKKRGEVNGVQGLEIVDSKKAKLLEPELSPNVHSALYVPSSAIVCPFQLCIAAIGNAMDNGAELKLGFKVTEILKIGEGFVVKSESEELCSRMVINAAGINADVINDYVGGEHFEITPRRGEYLLLDNLSSNVKMTIFKVPNKMGKGILVAPTVDGNLFAGPTSIDITDKLDDSVTKEGFAKILSSVLSSVANFDSKSVITSFTGLRAVPEGGDFIINHNEGFINVAGIESPGLSASPAIAEVVEEFVRNRLNPGLKPNFISTRKSENWFKELSIEEKNKVIKQQPSYGKIVCRCEQVTYGEIIEAIETHPKPSTIDGIKRRTRAGMGRCQGGFCSPSAMEILAKEYNIPIEDVTKKGGESRILVGKTK